jgi:cytochrome P450
MPAPIQVGPSLFEPLSREFIEDPYPTYRKLRAEDPVHWSEQLRSWVVSRYHDARRVLVEYDTYSADYRRAGSDNRRGPATIQSLDPPDHTAVRRVLSSSFHAALTPDVRALAQERAEKLLGTAAERGETTDFVNHVAVPLSLEVTLRLLGMDIKSRHLLEWSKAIIRDMMSGLEPGATGPGRAAREQLAETIEGLLESPGADGMTRHLAEADGIRELPRSDVVNSLRVVLLAGINSTQRFLANSLLALLSNPDAFKALGRCTAPAKALHELARYDSPVQAQEKMVLADTELGGRRLRRGDLVVALTGSANRDEAVFSRPDALVLDRTPNPHVGFGAGHHTCLGVPLALLVAQATLPYLSRRFPRTRLVGSPVRDSNPALRGMLSLPVSLHS